MIYDVAIIGSGPGGYIAAEEAIKYGLNVILFEKEKLGGICLNYGCIPTKALLYSAELFYNARNKFSEHGIYCNDLRVDLKRMVSHSQEVINTLSSGLKILLNKAKCIYSEVTSIYKTEICNIKCLDGNIYKSKNVIIAIGGKHRDIGIKGWTYKEALKPDYIPSKLAIIGSGAIGMEFACFYSSIGSSVTVFEKENHILPSEDIEISKEAERVFSTRDIKFIKGNKNNDLSQFDQILVAAGIVPNQINVPNLKINDMGYIETNEYCQTNIENIYAIGDVTSPPWLAHKASREAIIAINKIMQNDIYTRMHIPSCIYTYPQIASIGLREQDIQDKNIRIVKYPLSNNGLSVAKGQNGFIKFIINQNDEILGCHMIGHGVSEIIQYIVLMQSFELTVREMADIVYPHPTLCESILEISKKSITPGGNRTPIT